MVRTSMVAEKIFIYSPFRSNFISKGMSAIERLKYYYSNCGEMTRSTEKVHILVALLVCITNFEKSFVTINVDFFDCKNIVSSGEKTSSFVQR